MERAGRATEPVMEQFTPRDLARHFEVTPDQCRIALRSVGILVDANHWRVWTEDEYRDILALVKPRMNMANVHSLAVPANVVTRPMHKIPGKLGPIHFIGIGGIGMSGIAEVLLNQGYRIQGSDIVESRLTNRLAKSGARIFPGQEAKNVADAEVVVISSAIKSYNPELREARRLGLPVVRRAEMLAELMRLRSNVAVAGTHGKTTTTTMVATLLDRGDFDPTVVNGGIISDYGSNSRTGEGDWMVVEADESDGTFVKLPATIAVVTSLDPEHLDHYGSFDNLRKAFDAFVSNIPFYGVAICCVDHPEVAALVRRITDRRIVTYGFGKEAAVRAENLRYEGNSVRYDIILQNEGISIPNCVLPMPGDHNVSNSLAAAAVARHLGVGEQQIREGLAGFAGVGRRFTLVGEVGGVRVIDDYGHHPVEIKAVLSAARKTTEGRIVAVHQPHRFTRLSTLFDDFRKCFDLADVVGITEIYAAGEQPIPGVDHDALVSALRKRGHPNAQAISGEEGFYEFAFRETRPGDLLVSLGAGSISAWTYELVRRLAIRRGLRLNPGR